MVTGGIEVLPTSSAGLPLCGQLRLTLVRDGEGPHYSLCDCPGEHNKVTSVAAEQDLTAWCAGCAP